MAIQKYLIHEPYILTDKTQKRLNINEISMKCGKGEPSQNISNLLTNSNYNPKDIDKLGRTALHYAAMNGRRSVIQLLLNNNYDANSSDFSGFYPIHLAIEATNYEAVNILIEYTKPNSCNSRFENAVIALAKTEYNNKYTYKLLDKMRNYGYNLNYRGAFSDPAIFYSIDNIQFLKELIKMNVNVNALGEYDRSCLFQAVYINKLDSIQCLIDAGCSLELKDEFGHTALMMGCSFGRLESVKLLVENGANINSKIVDVKGETMTAIMYAIKHSNYNVAEYLAMNDADLDINVSDTMTIWDLLCYDKTNMVRVWNPATNKIYTCESTTKRNKKFLRKLIDIYTQKKYNAMIKSSLICELNVPKEILLMIANPLKW